MPEIVNNDGTSVKVKPLKKKAGVPKIFKNKYFIFSVSVILFALSIFVLFLMDEENIFRPAVMDSPFFLQLLSFLGIKKFNVGITTWFIFCCFFSIVFATFFIVLFYKYFKKRSKDKFESNNGFEWPKSRKVRFNVLFFGFVAICVAGAATFIALWFPFDKLNWNPTTINIFANFFQSLLILICLLLVVPVAIAIILLIFKLIVLLFSILIGGITRSVMSSASYQEAWNTSQVLSARIRKEVEDESASKVNVVGGEGGFGGGSGRARNREDQDILFPALTRIDEKWANGGEVKVEEVKTEETTSGEPVSNESTTTETVKEIDTTEVKTENPSEENEEVSKLSPVEEMKDLALGFQAFLANKNQLYYDIDLLRSFIAGLASSRLILLEGLSGTGKSTLPRMFLEYIGGKAFFFPVQATWRDKSDIIGYYSDFTGQYKETELLKHLYEASYTPSAVNLMVLDEANISRMEYYFADFLSIFEYPSEDWLVPLMQIKPGQKTPKFIEEGMVRIPVNTWFIGTLNVDDSTFTVSDKVYDRAIVIDFKELNLPFTSKFNDNPHPLTCTRFSEMVIAAQEEKKFRLNKAEREKFLKLCDFATELFDIRFGNRIMNQIDNFVPIFVALGGKKEKALDIMYARKILRKLETLYDNYVDAGLVKLSRYIIKEYGRGIFTESELLINKFRKKFF